MQYVQSTQLVFHTKTLNLQNFRRQRFNALITLNFVESSAISHKIV